MQINAPPWLPLTFTILVFLFCPHRSRAYDFTPAPDCRANEGTTNGFFITAHQFTSIPTEGITMDADAATTTNSYLINGESDELLFRFTFMPPSGVAPSDYKLSFSCDNALVYTTSSCSISNIVTNIIGSDDSAYNTTVTCIYSRFPGSTQCILSAELDTTTAAGQPTSTYTSPSLTNNVYGIVAYLPDSFGALSESATIVSGTGNSYTISSYDRTTAAVRQIETYGIIPGGASLQGEAGVSFFQSATVGVVVGDYITRFDVASCGLTNAAVTNDGFTLPDSSTCGVGVATLNETTFPAFGIQLRTYKSGNFSLTMAWSSLGSAELDYEQVLVFDVEEVAPPVITALSRADQYRSTPCETQTVTLSAFNSRYADIRQLVVSNTDGTSTIWLEQSGSPSYDATTDISTLSFESGGGIGINVPLILNATFGTEYRQGIVLNNDPSLTLSFSSPPLLTGMSPTTVPLEGGEIVTLTGTFEDFGSDSSVFMGGYQIPFANISITGTTQLSFTSPARSDVGQLYSYDVVVARCAERSSALTLSYITDPTVTITTTNSSTDSNGNYLVPANNSAGFVAEVSGNNVGVTYLWEMFASGTEVDLNGATNTAQTFIVSPSIFTASSTNYVLRSTVTNSLGRSSQAEVQIQRLEANSGYIFVTVYAIENLTRSTDGVTLVQSSVQTSSDANVTLVWDYGSETYNATDPVVFSQSTANGTTTGPTKFGLEFNIARQNLQVGETTLTLTATVNSDPPLSGSDSITITVRRSNLAAVINDGLNGTLVQSGNSIRLFAGNSYDPDVLDSEGNQQEGISYTWFRCVKSLQATFASGVESCDSILPADASLSSITLSSDDLLAQRLDTSSNPSPTFFSFGLRVSKDDRSAEEFSYFELRTVQEEQIVPVLSSLELVDSKGVAITRERVSIFSNVIVQPTATDTSVLWSFDMVPADQRYLLATSGVLLLGAGYVSERGKTSRLPMGFAANSLRPATEYIVRVTATRPGTSLETDYELRFTTAEFPRLSCQSPASSAGTILQTELTVSATLSFGSPTIEYCFFLIGQARERYSLGKGCSSVPFATFKFPRSGIYDIECLAKSSKGAIIANVSLDTNIVLSTPTPSANTTLVDALRQRLDEFIARMNECDRRRDHSCITNLITVANAFALEVEAAVASDSSDTAVQLLDKTKAYIVRLSTLSKSLAENTVFRPNQMEDSIDQSFYLSHVPGTMVEDEGTLFAMLTQLEGAVTATESSQADPINIPGLKEKVISTANLTLITAHSLARGGTTRRRLLSTDQTRSSFATLQMRTPNFIAQFVAQQEGCGFLGEESTNYPDSLRSQYERSSSVQGSAVQATQIRIGVACDRDQVNVPMSGLGTSSQICSNALAGRDGQRVVPLLIEIPRENIDATGLNNDLDIYVTEVAYMEVKGLSELPDKCATLRLGLRQSRQETTQFDNLTAGTFEGLTADFPDVCTPEKCYVYHVDSGDTYAFTSQQVEISTRNQGLFVAGNWTRAVVPEPFTLEGFGVGRLKLLTIVSMVAAFALVAMLVSWMAVTSAASGVADIDTGWEYVERDMFGRGTVESNATSSRVDSQQ